VKSWFWVEIVKRVGLWTVFALTIISALHYVYLLAVRLRVTNSDKSAARTT